jgi:hypothetical protein
MLKKLFMTAVWTVSAFYAGFFLIMLMMLAVREIGWSASGEVAAAFALIAALVPFALAGFVLYLGIKGRLPGTRRR